MIGTRSRIVSSTESSQPDVRTLYQCPHCLQDTNSSTMRNGRQEIPPRLVLQHRIFREGPHRPLPILANGVSSLIHNAKRPCSAERSPRVQMAIQAIWKILKRHFVRTIDEASHRVKHDHIPEPAQLPLRIVAVMGGLLDRSHSLQCVTRLKRRCSLHWVSLALLSSFMRLLGQPLVPDLRLQTRSVLTAVQTLWRALMDASQSHLHHHLHRLLVVLPEISSMIPGIRTHRGRADSPRMATISNDRMAIINKSEEARPAAIAQLLDLTLTAMRMMPRHAPKLETNSTASVVLQIRRRARVLDMMMTMRRLPNSGGSSHESRIYTRRECRKLTSTYLILARHDSH